MPNGSEILVLFDLMFPKDQVARSNCQDFGVDDVDLIVIFVYTQSLCSSLVMS